MVVERNRLEHDGPAIALPAYELTLERARVLRPHSLDEPAPALHVFGSQMFLEPSVQDFRKGGLSK
jgi:hypothetical protein